MNKYQKKLTEFWQLSRNFDVRTAVQYIKNRHTLGHEKFSVYVQQLLEDYFKPVIDYYQNGNKNLYTVRKCRELEGKIVWMCWWQGENGMPDVVDMCVKQMRAICERLPDVTFVLITKDNYRNYIELPEFIIEKLDRGIINLTAFSDVLRQCLLSAHGGAWIDATVLCTSETGIQKLFETPYFSIKIEKEKINKASEGQVLTKGKWAGFFLNNMGIDVFAFVCDCLLYYWERKDYLINFYMQNYCIKIAVDHFDEIGKVVNSQPVFCNHVYFIEECFKQGKQPAVVDDTYFYKLSYKIFSNEQIQQLKVYLEYKGVIQG